MLETNKQALLFNSAEDLRYLPVILRYKLRAFIKIYDDFVTDGIFRRHFYYVTISDRQETFGGI